MWAQPAAPARRGVSRRETEPGETTGAPKPYTGIDSCFEYADGSGVQFSKPVKRGPDSWALTWLDSSVRKTM
jgi:hypothetical protein